MKSKFLFPIIFPLTLSSCYVLSYDFVDSFCVIESGDEVFKSVPSAANDSFYFYLQEDNEMQLMYCPGFTNGHDLVFFQNVSIQPFGSQVIDSRCFFDNSKVELSINEYVFEYLKSENLKDWQQIAHIRQAKDDELDAKYYTECSFKGLNNQLKLVFRNGTYGYIDTDNYKNADYVYLGDSSIFTFRLFGEYNDLPFIFNFLDNYEFTINDDGVIKAKGTYSSNRERMILHFQQNEIFDITSSDVELEIYFGEEKTDVSGSHDLSQYVDENTIYR